MPSNPVTTFFTLPGGEITTPGGIVPFTTIDYHQHRQRRLIDAFARRFSCRIGKSM
ncbi:MAG: hypothetical protein WCA60_03380 [Methanoregula sp.]